MAVKGKVIANPVTGQQIRFIQTAGDTTGALLEMESTYAAGSKEPPPHYHPYQSEDFTILEGEMTVRMNGRLTVLKKGDQLHIPPNTVHSMWNNTSAAAVINWKVQPAMDTEYFFENAMGLANDGKTKADGMPVFLQVVSLAAKYSGTFRLAWPPYGLQRLLFGILRPVAYLAGYRSQYKKYID